MNTLETWRPVIEALGWTLIHFIWQGMLVALLLAIVLRMLRRGSTNTRYTAACAALSLILVAPLTTMALISLSTPDKTASGPQPAFAAQPASQAPPDEIEPTIALLEMEQLRVTGPQLAVAANGGLLMNRIQRLVGAQPRQTNRFTGLFAGIIALIGVVSVGAGAQILLQSSSSADRQVVSAQQREAMRVNTFADTSGESHRAGAGQRKKAAEALGLLKQSSGESSMGALRKPLGEQGGVAPDQIVNQQAAAAESLRALHSSNPAERAVAACSLGRLGAVEAIPALINLLGDDASIQPLNCWESGRWSPALHTLKQASPGEQAAIALASLSRPAIEPLLASLSNANPSARRNAAWAIGEVTGASITDRSAAVEPLIALLSDADPWVRTAAAFSLGELRPRAATEALIAALGDASWNVRNMATRALGEMKARAGIESLTALLLRDENERVRRKAAWALGEIRDSSAMDALTAALTDQDQRVRATAKWAISEIRD